MTAQPTLFDVGRAQLPPRVLAFASGSNEARELRGFALAGVPAGFSAELIREEGVEELLRSNLPIFADSGAFSEVSITPNGPRVDHPISHDSWLRRLALYQRLALVHRDQLFVVAPDRVADQQHTLSLLERYRPQLQQLASTGAHVLVPVQRGTLSAETFYRRAVAVVGIPLVPALPMKKAGMSHSDVLRFAENIRPDRMHFLGMGYERRTAKSLVKALLAMYPGMEISLDSNRLRAVTGKARSLTVTERAMRNQPAGCLYGEVEHDALRGADLRLDYTDAIAAPGSWASEELLQRVAEEAFASLSECRLFLSDPDEYLQRREESEDGECCAVWERPLVSLALDRAWSAWVEAKASHAVRTAAIRQVFSQSTIANRSPLV